MKTQEQQQRHSTFVVIGVALILLLAMCSGCSTAVPVTARFPDPPRYADQPCPQLQKLDKEARLSDVAATVTINYSTYYDCAVRNDSWIEWYRIQREIYEKAGR